MFLTLGGSFEFIDHVVFQVAFFLKWIQLIYKSTSKRLRKTNSYFTAYVCQ